MHFDITLCYNLLAPMYFNDHWLGKGAVISNLVADLSSCCWLSNDMLPSTRLHNAFTAYYLELLLFMNANLKYKGQMESHYKARVTIRNTCRGLAHFILNYVFYR